MKQVKCILVDDKNNNLLRGLFDAITPYSDKYWIVENGGLSGLYSMDSLMQVLNCEWEKILFSSDSFIVLKSTLYGMYDLTGNPILPCIYKKIVCHNKCIAAIDEQSMHGVFNYDGTPILSCSWDKILVYDKALLAYKNHRKTTFDYCGNPIND